MKHCVSGRTFGGGFGAVHRTAAWRPWRQGSLTLLAHRSRRSPTQLQLHGTLGRSVASASLPVRGVRRSASRREGAAQQDAGGARAPATQDAEIQSAANVRANGDASLRRPVDTRRRHHDDGKSTDHHQQSERDHDRYRAAQTSLNSRVAHPYSQKVPGAWKTWRVMFLTWEKLYNVYASVALFPLANVRVAKPTGICVTLSGSNGSV